ncbi:serine O-acetyltransferase [Muricoccus nepalensis]|uniref:serine O-acetyltransferase n=1 Tax=Muricoccus nepalensis TaxID=1854500 RepID=UPI0019D5FDEB|nr:hypothetical protein [Roseomonas nepalensis]
MKEDYNNHYRDWTLPGFRAIATYRLGVWALSQSGLKKKAAWSLHTFLRRYVRNIYGIEIFATAKIGRRFHIGHQGGIVIHEHATIGDDCLVRQGVTFGAVLERDFVAHAPVVGNRVDVGAGAMIVGGVKIGDDVRIGPNAVVLTDVPAGATVFAPMSKIMPRSRAA